MRTVRRTLAIVGVAGALLVHGAPASARPRARTLTVCCAWGRAIADGLSFSVQGPPRASGVMSSAVRSWASAVRGLRLTQVADGAPADVRVRYRASGGSTQGRTTVTRDVRTGLILSAEIGVAGSYGTKPNPDWMVAQIVRHEFGHALGLGHADGDGDLMSPTIQGGAQGIGACDVKGVLAANRWILVAKAREPYRPVLPRVTC